MQRQVSTTVYWRSDTRPPSEIIGTSETPGIGFQPREGTSISDWWKEGIKPVTLTRFTEPEADFFKSICASTCLASAAIFPTADDETGNQDHITYLYAIAMLSPAKIDTNNKLHVDERLIPSNPDEMVIDLHEHQTEMVAGLLSGDYSEKEPIFARGIGTRLYGFEVIMAKVPPENIICAIKITRGDEVLIKTSSRVRSPVRQFTIEPTLFMNSRFSVLQRLSVFSRSQQPMEVVVDYSKDRDSTLSFLKKIPAGTRLDTLKPLDGLMGKTFGSPEPLPPRTPLLRPLSFYSTLMDDMMVEEEMESEESSNTPTF